jgi:hypothetical protein
MPVVHFHDLSTSLAVLALPDGLTDTHCTFVVLRM